MSKNAVIAAVVALVFISASFVVGVLVSGGADTSTMPLIAGVLGLIGTTIPAILALAKVEEVKAHIENGVVEAKAKSGAMAAIKESEVITRNGPVVATQLAALARLLEQNTQVTLQNTAAQTSENGGGENNGRQDV